MTIGIRTGMSYACAAEHICFGNQLMVIHVTKTVFRLFPAQNIWHVKVAD